MASKINGPWLTENIPLFHHIAKSKGVYKVRFPYFYRCGDDEERYKNKVIAALTEKGIIHKILDCGDYWAPFKSVAPIAKQSHFWVTFTID